MEDSVNGIYLCIAETLTEIAKWVTRVLVLISGGGESLSLSMYEDSKRLTREATL